MTLVPEVDLPLAKLPLVPARPERLSASRPVLTGDCAGDDAAAGATSRFCGSVRVMAGTRSATISPLSLLLLLLLLLSRRGRGHAAGTIKIQDSKFKIQ